MSKEHPRDDRERIDIVDELPPSAQGTYQYEREDGTIVRTDCERRVDASSGTPLPREVLGGRGLVTGGR